MTRSEAARVELPEVARVGTQVGASNGLPSPGADLRLVAARLVNPVRGLLALDQPRAEVDDLLTRARIEATEERCSALRAVVLSTPGLDRLVSAILLEPAALHPTAHRSGSPLARLGLHEVVIGVGMDILAVDLAAEISRHHARGARFAGGQLVLGDPGAGVDLHHRTRVISRWAAACQRGGLVPLIECVRQPQAQQGLNQAEEAYTTALTALLTALDRSGADPAATVLAISPVVPGRRSTQVDASEDVARATVRSLQTSGAHALAGVVFTPPAQAHHLTAHLAAIQSVGPDWPIGFCLGADLLRAVAATWRGRPGRVAAAQYELRSQFVSTTAVLRAGLREARPAIRA